MNRLAVVLTHNRPELLVETVAAIGAQVDGVVIVDNASDPAVSLDDMPDTAALQLLLTVPDQPPNLSQLWNQGIAAADALQRHWTIEYDEPEPWLCAVLCDDAPVPWGWFGAVEAAMLETKAAIGCSTPEPWSFAGYRVKTAPDSDLMGRMPGWAWILRPDSGVRADETLRWWWNDTDLDWAARAAGGMVMIGTHSVPNRRPNEFSARPAQAAQIALDSQRFVDKHGYRPW